MRVMTARLLYPEPKSNEGVRTKGCEKEAWGRKWVSKSVFWKDGGDWARAWIRLGRSVRGSSIGAL